MPYRLQFRRYSLPFRSVVRTAHGPWPVREGLLLRVDSDVAGGVAGFGEVATISWFGTESLDEAAEAVRSLGEWGELARFETVPRRLACLRNALASALADPVAPVRTSFGVAALLPAGRPALAAARAKAEAGFRAFKWKVGVYDPEDEWALLDDLCAVLPAGSRLRLDANGAWDRRRAEGWLNRCADRPVEFVEQPVAPDARAARDLLLGLAADHSVPIALDESAAGGEEIAGWLDDGWPGIFVVKPSLLGDPAETLRRLSAAKAPVVFSSALETGVGARAALCRAFAWAGDARALGFGVGPLFVDARFEGPAPAPFLRWDDVERMNPADLWTALD